MTKTITKAKQNSKGNITKVLFKGNSNYTPIKTAIRMAKRGQIENVHPVRAAKDKKAHIRTNPDPKKSNNLGEMAKLNS